MQEIALSSEERIISLCGGQSIDWVSFYNVAELILTRDILEDLRGGSSKASRNRINTLTRIQQQRRIQTQIHRPEIFNRTFNLWDCISATLQHDVGSPHDRIFALLGMLDDGSRSELAHLTYEMTLGQVYGAATTVIIEKQQHLYTLHNHRIYSGRANTVMGVVGRVRRSICDSSFPRV